MSNSFVNLDRDTLLLLPPDLRDWVPADASLQPQSSPLPRNGAHKGLNPLTGAVAEDKNSVRTAKTKNPIGGGGKTREHASAG
jgi:hypothetical protein